MRKVVWLLSVLLLLSGCTKGSIGNIIPGGFAAIYTSSVSENSELIFTNEEGRETGNVKLEKQGIFTIIRTGSLLKLPVRFSDEIISLDLKSGRSSGEKSLEFPFYYFSLEGKDFTIYNSDTQGDIDFLTYELKTKDKSIVKRIKGFPQCAVVHNNRAYVYTDSVADNRQYINVIDLESLEIVDKIDVDSGQVGDIKVIGEWIFLTDMENSRLIRISLKNPGDRRIENMKVYNPRFIDEYKDKIIIIHSDYITVLNNKLEVVKTLEVQNQILRGKFHGGKLYLLTQEQGGVIIRVDIESLAIDKTIKLGERKGLLIQDFEVLSE